MQFIRAKPFESILERARIMPVMGPNISAMVGRYTTTVDDNAKDNESDTSYDFDHGQHKLNFSIPSDSKDLDDAEKH